MDIQSITALSWNNLNSIGNDQHINGALALDFNKMLHTATEKAENSSEFISAEQSLQTRYPGLNYQVLDASQFTYWNRLDFPVSKIFEKNVDFEALKSWTPKTSTSTGYEPYVQEDLEKVPRGAYTVFIHPKIQEKMNQDPEYAKYIVQKIEKHFENNVRTNEAISPGCTEGMSQAVTITENGEIGLQASVVDGPNATKVDSEEATTKKAKEGQKLLDNSSQTSLPLPFTTHTVAMPLTYDYRYAYALIEKRKLKDNIV